MKDLLEELFGALAMPSDEEIVSDAGKQLALNVPAAIDRFAPMQVLSLKDTEKDIEIDRLLALVERLEASAELCLFDAGIAVPLLLGHQAFSASKDAGDGSAIASDVDLIDDFSATSNFLLEQVIPNSEPAAEFSVELPALSENAFDEQEVDSSDPIINLSDGDFYDDESDDGNTTQAIEVDAIEQPFYEADETHVIELGEADEGRKNASFSEADYPAADHLAIDYSDTDRSTADAIATDYLATDEANTADVSLDDLIEPEPSSNFLSRWLGKLFNPTASDLAVSEAAALEPPSPEFPSTKPHQSNPPQARLFSELEQPFAFTSSSPGESTTENFLSNAENDFLDVDATAVLDENKSEESSRKLDDSESDDSELDQPNRQSSHVLTEAAQPEQTVFETADAIARQPPAADSEPDVEQALAGLLDAAFADTLFETARAEANAEDAAEDAAEAEDRPLESLEKKDWLEHPENANEALHIAAAAGDLSGVWRAFEANASANALNDEQRTALSVAVEAGHLPVVEMLLEMCADPNRADKVNGSSVRYPLTVAANDSAQTVREPLIQLLLTHGAQVNQTDVLGQTALMGAAEQGHLDAMELLIEANAEIDASDLLGQTAMMRAEENGYVEAIALLQESLAQREQAIAFLKAVTQGDLETVRQWLAVGISPNTRVARMSALTQAAAKGEIAIARLLLGAGADVDYRFRPTDPTPLFHAVYRGQLEMVKLLLASGASTHPTDSNVVGALDYAVIGQARAKAPDAFEPIMALLSTLAKRPA